MAKLRAEGLYDRSLIVVTADHGISFQRRSEPAGGRSRQRRGHRQRAHVRQAAGAAVRPSGRRCGTTRSTFCPTVADAVGVRLVGSVDGSPLGESRRSRAGVKVSSYTGNPVEISFEDFVRRRDAEVRSAAAPLRKRWFRGRLRVRPRRRALRAPGRQRPGCGRAGFRVDLDLRSGFASFSPDAASVPAFLTGRLSGRAEGGELVAIAVNGRIAAVTRSFRDADQSPRGRDGARRSRFALGRTRIEAFAVSGAAPALRLARVGGTGCPERVAGRGG